MTTPEAGNVMRRPTDRDPVKVRIGLILLGIGLAMILSELAIRASWALFGEAEAQNWIDPRCRTSDAVPLRAGESFTGFYQFDDLILRRWVPDSKGIQLAVRPDGSEGEPITISTNEHGWRDVPHSLEKSPGTYRIVVIGDSFGEPYRRPLEEGIPRRLEAWLNEQSLERKVEVINLSIAGNSPVDYGLLVRFEAPRFDPDLIVILLFTRNDLSGELLEQTVEVNGRIVYAQEHVDAMRQKYEDAIRSPAIDGSLTWDELETARGEGRLVVAREAADGTRSYEVRLTESRNDAATISRLHCSLQRVSRAYTWLTARLQALETQPDADSPRSMSTYQTPPSPEIEQAWLLYERLLAQMAMDTPTKTRIVFVTLANGDEVYSELFEHGLRSRGLSREEHDPNYPTERAAAICQRNNLNCWFMLPAFKAAAATAEGPLFDGGYDARRVVRKQLRWGHYTTLGYKLVAEAVGQQLLDAGWLVTSSTGPGRSCCVQGSGLGGDSRGLSGGVLEEQQVEDNPRENEVGT